jgi:hypothetical protein
MGARRAMAVLGGMLSGFAGTAALTTIAPASSDGGFVLGGLAAGAGIGLMVAATLRESG